MRGYIGFSLFLLIISFSLKGQNKVKHLRAVRTQANFKIDGNITEPAWREVAPATGFIAFKPVPGVKESPLDQTLVYILYDNSFIYVGGYCHETSADSVTRELVGRDVIGASDYIGIILDTYLDKANAFGFYVTAYGEQYDVKYSKANGEDVSWNAVWESAAQKHLDGWSFEMKIPYSAIRFNAEDQATWGLNLVRYRSRAGQQLSWNPVNPNISGFLTQEGLWTGIEKLSPPVRLSITPYVSSYLNHYPYHSAAFKDFSSSFNAGADIKYGINESFTLDMALVPDFGQVQSDNQVLNLTPFEVRYNENRSFFTEGTELFNKGGLFYSRRIGGTPLHFYDVGTTLDSGSSVLNNPTATKILNAFKISGRNRNGLGLGVFNAVSQAANAQVLGTLGRSYYVQTSPLADYNILVLDQSLPYNSSLSFVNTSVLRKGEERSADVWALLYDGNNKKNNYNWNGKFSMSHLWNLPAKTNGFSYDGGFGKTSGTFTFSLNQELISNLYDPNDLGLLLFNNSLTNSFKTRYRWSRPSSWFNSMAMSQTLTYARRYTPSSFASLTELVIGNIQLKSLMLAGFIFNFTSAGNDYYEPRVDGRVYRSPNVFSSTIFLISDAAKRYSYSASLQIGSTALFHGYNYDLSLTNNYRFSDKFSMDFSLDVGPVWDNVGYVATLGEEIIFGRRNRNTVENIFHCKYNFNNRSGFSMRARHYWSGVHNKAFFLLQPDGKIQPDLTYTENQDQTLNFFTIDMLYTWQFGPGSFLNLVWKNSITSSSPAYVPIYVDNIKTTLQSPENNSLSLKWIYYFDFQKFRKRV